MNTTISEQNLVKLLRKNAHITQRELATRLGVTQQEISKLECSNTKLTLDMLSKICTQLELSPIITFNVNGYTPILDTNLISAFNAIQNFSSDNQILIFNLIHQLS